MKSAHHLCTAFCARLAPLALILALVFVPGCQRGSGPIDRAGLAEQVRAEFLHAWSGYKSFA
ncbi:MAG TPA: hypothetical protein PKI81_09165, partial [bacterium]|nr:hypothetical protein [bacterium]